LKPHLPGLREGENVVIERIYQKTERTPEEKVRIQAIREKFQREKPSLDDLLATGEYDGPVPQGAYLELRRLMHILRKERERLGLSLADVAERTGIDKAALSRLETGKQINPTIDTLWRYAHAVGRLLTWTVIAGAAPATPKADGRSRKGSPPKPRKREGTRGKGGSRKA
jgi:ribosome-binding protein aMBF1 (putative translation factor)